MLALVPKHGFLAEGKEPQQFAMIRNGVSKNTDREWDKGSLISDFGSQKRGIRIILNFEFLILN